MHGLVGERVLMRIHIGERDKFHGFRGIMGFGATARLHSDKVLRLSVDLPLVIECVDTEEKLNAILPELDEMIGGGLITLEKAHVIMYRPAEG